MRMMHTMIRVRDLEESIRFYSERFGMKVLRRLSEPDGKSVAFIGFGDEAHHTVLELNHSPDKLEFVRGEYFGHLAIGVPDVEALYAVLREAGVKTLKPPRQVGDEVLASVEDPNGYKIELIEDSHASG